MQPSNEAYKEAMTPLAVMAGKWAGQGWMYTPQREKLEFQQTEDIEFRLDSTVLLIQGRGTHEGEVVHDALAILSYEPEAGHYWMQSYLANGRGGKFRAQLKDGPKLEWEIEAPGRKITYLIDFSEEGQWLEEGFMAIGESAEPFKFFEMKLKRQ